MSQPIYEGGRCKNFTATGTIVPGTAVADTGILIGVFCSSTSSGTLKVADSTGTIANTFSPAAGTFYPLPTTWSGTLTITIGNTLDVTVFFTNA